MGPWHLQWQLPIGLLGPIIFSAGVVDVLRWAYNIYNSSCRFIHLGPLFYQQVLLMLSDGPIAFTIRQTPSGTSMVYVS